MNVPPFYGHRPRRRIINPDNSLIDSISKWSVYQEVDNRASFVRSLTPAKVNNDIDISHFNHFRFHQMLKVTTLTPAIIR